MTMDRKTALKRLHLLLDCEMSDPEEANALRFAIEYLGDLQDEELERAYLSLSTALTAKNTTDLTEETVRAACNALHAYYRDRYESANVKPTRCAEGYPRRTASVKSARAKEGTSSKETTRVVESGTRWTSSITAPFA